MTWQIESFADVGGNKDEEFVKFIDLPSANAAALRAGDQRPQQLLRQHGWDTVDAMAVSRTPAAYRGFIHGSKAEFGVAKHTYVASRSGWFSDRTECYLASGRPALVQDTGWTAHLPSGDGLLAFSTPEEALAGIDTINTAYNHHARCALDIAREHFGRIQGAAEAARDGPRMRIAISRRSPRQSSPKSGSVETMTSLLTEGLVALGTTSRCTPPQTRRRKPV